MSTFYCLSVNDARQLLQQEAPIILDIRDEAAFQMNHIPGARRLDNGNVHDLLQTLEFDQPVLVYCYHGIASQQAAAFLVEQGFEQVYSLDGGFEGWKSFSEQEQN